MPYAELIEVKEVSGHKYMKYCVTAQFDGDEFPHLHMAQDLDTALMFAMNYFRLELHQIEGVG